MKIDTTTPLVRKKVDSTTSTITTDYANRVVCNERLIYSNLNLELFDTKSDALKKHSINVYSNCSNESDRFLHEQLFLELRHL